MADSDYSYATWVAKGSPGGDFSAWQRVQPGYGTTQVNGPTTEGYAPSTDVKPPNASLDAVSPAGFEQRLAAGEFKGNEAEATQLEARRRRNNLSAEGMKPLPADVADIVLRDASGQVRKARSGSTQSALGAAFNVKSSLFGAR